MTQSLTRNLSDRPLEKALLRFKTQAWRRGLAVPMEDLRDLLADAILTYLQARERRDTAEDRRHAAL